MRLKYAIGIRSAGIVNAVARKFTALLRDRSGHVAMIFGIATIPLFVSVGVAVDMVQQSRVHLKLAGTADAIALAAARSYKDVDNRDAVGNRYLDANLASDYGPVRTHTPSGSATVSKTRSSASSTNSPHAQSRAASARAFAGAVLVVRGRKPLRAARRRRFIKIVAIAETDLKFLRPIIRHWAGSFEKLLGNKQKVAS